MNIGTQGKYWECKCKSAARPFSKNVVGNQIQRFNFLNLTISWSQADHKETLHKKVTMDWRQERKIIPLHIKHVLLKDSQQK